MLFLPKGPPGPAPIRWLADILDLVLVLMGFVMVGIVSVNVSIRVVKFDVAFTTELCEFLMTWVTFLGGAAVIRRCGHMTITEFIDKLSVKPRLIADGFVQVFCAFVMFVCMYFGITLVNRSWETSLVILQWPIAVQYLALPVGCGLSLIFILYDIYQILRGVPRAVRYGEEDN